MGRHRLYFTDEEKRKADRRYCKTQREKHPVAIEMSRQKWLRYNPEWKVDRNLKAYYGITLEDWNVLFGKQQGRCAICGVHQSELSQKLSVDHDHNNGIVRGLLCNRCNRSLGIYENWSRTFSRQIEDYLNRQEDA